MAKLLFGVLAFGWTVAIVASTTSQFNDMVKITTYMYTLDNYTNYGCHCRSNAMQGAPMDETDKCCHEHACCYDEAQKKGCVPDTTTYGFYPHKDHKIRCIDTHNKCEEDVCECDKEAAECFRKKMDTYNQHFHSMTLPPSCQGPKPSC